MMHVPLFSYGVMMVVWCCMLMPWTVSAHQPQITETRLTEISEPEISKAYYGTLTGEPDVYVIRASESFDLYVNILVPDILNQEKNISVTIEKEGTEIAALDGAGFTWEQFYEPFGADTYWMGPEYRASAAAGTYTIRVFGSVPGTKYVLAVGEIEAFGAREGLGAFTLIPELKKNFFNTSPASFIVSPMGWGFIAVLYLFAGIVGFILRALWKRFSKSAASGAYHNIGMRDRLLRISIGVVLLFIAIFTTWNPALIFLSGFCFFQAFFSWCGLYAILGKNTCPISN